MTSTDLICLLDSYDALHTKASSDLKISTWNLNKARRHKGGNFLSLNNSFTALNVREELRASARLQCKDGPGIDEEEKGHNKLQYATRGSVDEDWIFLRLDDQQKEKSVEENVSTDEGMLSAGLRRRKGATGSEPTEESNWSVETYEDVAEERLRQANPIDLFGAFPPTDLKVAQKNARDSLASYIKAANIAAEILHITSL
jgi:hypothetical protein